MIEREQPSDEIIRKIDNGTQLIYDLFELNNFTSYEVICVLMSALARMCASYPDAKEKMHGICTQLTEEVEKFVSQNKA